MRRLIADVFKILYKITNNKLFSLSFALIYIAILNLLTIRGLCLLLSGLVPYIELISRIFSKPYIFVTILVAILLNFWIMLPLENLSKERQRPYSIASIIIYTFVALILFLYSRYVIRAY